MNQDNHVIGKKMVVINMGLESLYEDIVKQGVPSIHVQWRPAAGGNERLMEIIDKLRDKG